MEWLLGILAIVLPGVSSVVTYAVGKSKRKNDFLGNLQGSIDLLTEKYTAALDELTKLRGENLELRTIQQKMLVEMKGLKLENAELKRIINELNEKLENVKTITKTK